MSIDLRTLTAIIFNDTSKKAVKSFKFLSIYELQKTHRACNQMEQLPFQAFLEAGVGVFFLRIRCRRAPSVSLRTHARRWVTQTSQRCHGHRRGITSHAAPLCLWSQCRSAAHHSLSRIPREGNALLENLSFWRRLWPIASLAAAVLVNAIWIGALAYRLARLL